MVNIEVVMIRICMASNTIYNLHETVILSLLFGFFVQKNDTTKVSATEW